MNKFWTYFLLVSSSSVSASNARQTNGVYELDSHNFEATLNEHHNILVQFCNYKLQRCQEQAKELEQAAELIKSEGLEYKIGKCDINGNERYIKKYIGNAKAQKTLFFRNPEEKVNYSGRDSAPKMVHWLTKFNDNLTAEVTCEQLKGNDVQNNEFTLAYFGDQTSSLYKKTFERYALTEERIQYVSLGQEEAPKCADEFGIQGNDDGIVFFRNFDKANFLYVEDHDEPKKVPVYDQLKNFVNPLLLPSYFEWIGDEDQEIQHYSLIFDTPQSALFLIGADLNADYMKVYEESAMENKGKIPFTYGEALPKSFLFRQSYKWQVPKEDFPVLIGYVPRGNQKSVFHTKPQDFTVDLLSEFAEKIASGVVDAPRIRSEAAPQENEGLVKKIVGQSFREIALDKDQNVFVYFHKGSSDEEIDKTVLQAALALKDQKDVAFGKIDMSLNEVRRSELNHLNDEKFPYFFLYEKGEKKRGIQWSHRGNISEDTMVSFIMKNTKKEQTPQRSGRKEPKKNSKQEHLKKNRERAQAQFAKHDEL